MITKNSSGNSLNVNYASTVQEDSRGFLAMFLLNGVEVDCGIAKFEIAKGSCGSLTEFSIGNLISSMLTANVKALVDDVKGKELEVRIGLDIGGSYEWITLGFFKITDVKKTIYTTVLTGYGKITSEGGNDFSVPTTPSLSNIAYHLGIGMGCTVTLDSNIDGSLLISQPLTDLTNYQALQILTNVIGGYAVDTNDGNIKVCLYDDTPTLAVNSGMMTLLPDVEEEDFEITGIRVTVSEAGYGAEGEIPATGYESSTPINLLCTDKYMTQALFDDMETHLVGYTYRPASIKLSLGDPRLEGNDVLSVTDADGNVYVVPCHSVKHIYDGGLLTQIEAVRPTNSENGIGSLSPMQKALSGLASRVVSAEEDAREAREIAGNTNQYFWFEGQDADETGAHITEVPQDDWKDPTSPGYHSGGNLFARSTGIALRDGMTEVATFSERGVRTGRDGGYKTFVGSDGFSWGIAQGELFKLGYVGDRVISVVGDQETWSPINTNQSKVFDWLILVPKGTAVRITANGHDADIVAGVASTNDYLTYDGEATIVNRVTGDYLIKQPSYSYAPPNMRLGKPDDDEHRTGCYSAEFGEGVVANSDNQVAIGKFNVIDTYNSSTPDGAYVIILGNGSSLSRSNAFAVKRNGIIEAENVMAYGECSTASATVAKEVTVAFGSFTLQTGATIAVKFANANSASNPTLNVNGTGAKAIMRYGTTASGTSAGASWNAGSVVSFLYDGTYWQMIGFNNTTYSGMSDAEYQAGTGTTNRLITPARLKAAIAYWVSKKASLFSSRQASANLTADGQTGISHFLGTSTMTTGKPNTQDGHIIHMAWDNTGGWDEQIYVENGATPKMFMRSQSNGTWGSWVKVYSANDKPTASDVGAVPTSRKVNNKALSSDISLTAGDVGAVARSAVCYANSRVDTFSSSGQVTIALSSLGITTGAKPVGILLTYQDGGASPTILRYDYDASSASGVVIKAYNSTGGAVSGAVRYFAVVFQNSWTSV